MLGSRPVHRIGYGAMQLAGYGPERDRAEALRVLRLAVEGGVDYVDTAQYYGSGLVNRLIREALQPYPNQLAIVSKVAVGPAPDSAVTPAEDASQIRQDVEDNLTALGTDRLAAVNLRMTGTVADEHFDAHVATLAKIRDEGVIDGVGLSNISREQLLRAVDQTEIVCVQNLFNLADQRSLDILTECVLRDIAFVPYCPLGWPRDVQNELLTSPVLAALAARLTATPAQLALAWLLDLAPNILLIPGTRTRTHLSENLRAADVVLDDAARAELAAHFPVVH